MEYYLNVSKKGINKTQITAITNHPFLISDIIYKVFDDKIIFTKPTLDYKGRTVNFGKIRDGYVCQATLVCDLEIGKHYFDTQENEDELILIKKQPNKI